MFGNPEVTPGGRALKFYASVRLDVRRAETLKQGTESVGARTRVRIVKNKLAPPFRQAEFDLIYGEGISREGGLVDVATELGIIEKSGAWYSFRDTRLGQGRENVREFLKENQQLAGEIEAIVRERLKLGGVKAQAADDDRPAE
jgi:recombination protein RecA